ncbi:MAG: rhomboid family intramembrane serine protease [Saprospiraceae bacterium]|nr:rhomboid family intramembrane serine protease [Saprospiraceae bacterium]
MQEERSPAQPFAGPFWTAVRMVAVLWVIHLLRYLPLFPWPATDLGIYPRRLFGLSGILTAPLTHSSWTHLTSNSVPLLAMITVIWAFYRRVSWPAFLMVYALTGVAVWIFARPVFHIGASGVVYGLVSFVFWSGIFRRSLKSVVLALIVVLVYTPMFAGVLPNQEGISWESHLLGGFVGIFVAWWFRQDIEPEEQAPPALPQEELRPFLDPDTFERTRSEREGW